MLAARIESALRRALAESTAARTLCAGLAGRSLRVVATSSPWAATLRTDGTSLRLDLANADREPVDATMSGSLPALLALLGPERRELVARGNVQVDGDTEVAERYARLLQLLRPDPEALLGRGLGRAPAHLVAEGARAALAQGQALLGNLAAAAGDYLAHERRDLATGAEAAEFRQGVAELAARVARLDALLRPGVEAETAR